MADALPPVEPPIAPGQIIAERYLVGEVLGGGGMGVVYAGTHVLLGTRVAIKLIHSELRQDAEAVQRFMNEARAAALLKGEHIARVFDVGMLDTGEPYFVMEQLEGRSLDQHLLERGALGTQEACDIVMQACQGLAEAHATGLVHRDIKPPNLFLARLPNGQFSLKILDFGIVKQRVEQDTPALTNPGKSLGSPWYMSPEQMLTPASVDERADVWSLGVLLFELLTGKRPFDGETVPQVCAIVLTAPAPRPSEQRRGVPVELDEIVLRCLEKEPGSRFATVAELAAALIPFASEPSHDAGLALEDARATEPPKEPREAKTYGSLVPLSTGSSLVTVPRTRSLFILGSLSAALLLAWVGWIALHERPSATRVAAAESSVESARLPEREAPTLLQALHTALATLEPERAPLLAPASVEPLSAADRAARYEAWLRAQGLSRIPSEPDAPTPPSSEPELP